jgi:hypothetical protein
MRRRLHRLTSDWLPHATVQFGFAVLLTAVTGVVLKVLAKAGTPLIVLACLGVFFVALGLTMRAASGSTRSDPAIRAPEADAPDPAPSPPVTEATERFDHSSETLPTAPTTPAADRVFVPRTPRELVGLFERQTSVQAQKQADAFYGKWFEVSGVISDIGAWHGESSLGFSQVTTYFDIGTERLPVYMMFRDRECVENRLSVLGKDGMSRLACDPAVKVVGTPASNGKRRLAR